jgi:hypothetical protein
MTTQKIIKQLARMECVNYNHYSAPKLCTKAARDRLEELQRESAAMVNERNNTIQKTVDLAVKLCHCTNERDEARAEVAQLRDTVAAYEQAAVKQSLTTRPEPSRLEIAAMLMAGSFSREEVSSNFIGEARYSVLVADALVAAAREEE